MKKILIIGFLLLTQGLMSTGSSQETLYILHCSVEPLAMQSELETLWLKQFAAKAIQWRLESKVKALGCDLRNALHWDNPTYLLTYGSESNSLQSLGFMLLELEFAKTFGITEDECESVKQFYREGLEPLEGIFAEDSLALINSLDVCYIQSVIGESLKSLNYLVQVDNPMTKEHQDRVDRLVYFIEERGGLYQAKNIEQPSIMLCSYLGEDGMEYYDDDESNEEQAQPNPFLSLPLHHWEKKNISKIITSMAEKTLPELFMSRKELEKKGDQINHVHPMRFIGYVFGTGELKWCMGKVSGNSFKWNSFIEGYAKRMREEACHNNLERHVEGFSSEVKADPGMVMEFIRRADYEGLVVYLTNK